MIGWERFVEALEPYIGWLLIWLLLLCIVGLIRALAGREHQEGG